MNKSNKIEVLGIGRTRHGDKGAISNIHLNPYTMCIHTLCGGGWPTMQVLVAEFYEDEMSRRSKNIAFKVMPNGNIRAYQADKKDKRGVSELQFTNPQNESPTVIIGNTIKIIETNMTEQNAIELPSELKGKKFRIRKLTPRECFRLMGVDDKDIDKIQAAGVSNSGQYKLAGNSIVVDVLYHIFRKLFVEPQNEDRQLQLF